MPDDPNPVDIGMEGVIDHIDSMGTLHVTWDDGRRLGVIPGEDEYELYPNNPITNLDSVFEGFSA